MGFQRNLQYIPKYLSYKFYSKHRPLYFKVSHFFLSVSLPPKLSGVSKAISEQAHCLTVKERKPLERSDLTFGKPLALFCFFALLYFYSCMLQLQLQVYVQVQMLLVPFYSSELKVIPDHTRSYQISPRYFELTFLDGRS